MKLNFVIFMVRDVKESVAFYQKLACIQVINHMSSEAGEIVFLANKKYEIILELIEFEGVEKVITKAMVLSFSAKNELEELREKALTLGYFPPEIISIYPKPKHFTVEYTDGIVVEFSV